MRAAESKLREGAVYVGNRGRLMCRACAGALVTETAHDASGQYVARLDAPEVVKRVGAGEFLACACGGVTLTTIPDGDGWPLTAWELLTRHATQ